MIGLISATAAGAAARDRLAAAWPDRTRVYDGPVADAVRTAFAECDRLVCFLATGAVVRLVAPLLHGKTDDPGVVCVDEAGRFAVSLLGGHGGGANELAREVGEVLGAEPVVTTATDAVGLPGLDTLGLPVEGDVAAVSRALLDGEAVALRAEVTWPLPPLPVAAEGAYTVRVTDRLVEPGDGEAVLRPPTLVVGVGASKDAPVEEVLGLVGDALREAGLSAVPAAAPGRRAACARRSGRRRRGVRGPRRRTHQACRRPPGPRWGRGRRPAQGRGGVGAPGRTGGQDVPGGRHGPGVRPRSDR
ncbi:hypothetical protein STENM223S_08814 [Streptomyces tendae]